MVNTLHTGRGVPEVARATVNYVRTGGGWPEGVEGDVQDVRRAARRCAALIRSVICRYQAARKASMVVARTSARCAGGWSSNALGSAGGCR